MGNPVERSTSVTVIGDHRLVLGVPSARSDRWPLLIVTFGWGTLSALTFAELAGRDGAGWAIISAGIGVLTFSFWLRGGALPRKAAAASTIAFGVARSVTYAADDIWSPVAVWTIVAGLALIAYRTSIRQDA